jgi:hypothetical protein
LGKKKRKNVGPPPTPPPPQKKKKIQGYKGKKAEKKTLKCKHDPKTVSIQRTKKDERGMGGRKKRRRRKRKWKKKISAQ